MLARLARLYACFDGLADLRTEEFVRRLLAESPRYADPRSLARFEVQTYSQGGEDGILAEIFRRIGATDRSFVEFGVGDGLENNTALLVEAGWTGTWIEINPRSVRRIHQGFATPIAERRLRLVESIVQPDTVEQLFRAGDVPERFDLLSIDIDGNDYWVWQAIERFRPRVVVIEYNATYGADLDWVMAFDRAHRWQGTTRHGASLAALARLAQAKGYALVGCGLSGVNAFFVSSDELGDHFVAPFTAQRHHEPLRTALAIRRGPPRSFGASLVTR
jgi:hypothetical protein